MCPCVSVYVRLSVRVSVRPSVRVSVSIHSRTDREMGRILWGRTSEYGRGDDFPKSCAREGWDLLVDWIMED